MDDLISIIIPVYRVEKYLEECLNSVINQTYANLEIILIDDGSSDRCGQICDEYAKKDERIEVIHQENQGVSNARNHGIEMAKGKYITFVDSDDYLDQDYIKYLYDEITKFNADISICGTLDIDEKNNILKRSKKFEKTLNLQDAIKEMLKEKYYNSVIWAKMYQAELAKKAKFNQNLRIAEDLDYIYKILGMSKVVRVNTGTCLYYYRSRNDSATTNVYNENWEKEIEINKKIINDCEKNLKSIELYAIRRYMRINYTCMMKILRNNQNDEQYKILQKNVMEYLWKYIFSFKISIVEKFKLICAIYCKNITKSLIKVLKK